MSPSNVVRADRIQRNCAVIMTIAAVVLVASCLLSFADATVVITPLRAGIWALSMLLWLAILATGGGLPADLRAQLLRAHGHARRGPRGAHPVHRRRPVPLRRAGAAG